MCTLGLLVYEERLGGKENFVFGDADKDYCDLRRMRSSGITGKGGGGGGGGIDKKIFSLSCESAD